MVLHRLPYDWPPQETKRPLHCAYVRSEASGYVVPNSEAHVLTPSQTKLSTRIDCFLAPSLVSYCESVDAQSLPPELLAMQNPSLPSYVHPYATSYMSPHS